MHKLLTSSKCGIFLSLIETMPLKEKASTWCRRMIIPTRTTFHHGKGLLTIGMNGERRDITNGLRPRIIRKTETTHQVVAKSPKSLEDGTTIVDKRKKGRTIYRVNRRPATQVLIQCGKKKNETTEAVEQQSVQKGCDNDGTCETIAKGGTLEMKLKMHPKAIVEGSGKCVDSKKAKAIKTGSKACDPTIKISKGTKLLVLQKHQAEQNCNSKLKLPLEKNRRKRKTKLQDNYERSVQEKAAGLKQQVGNYAKKTKRYDQSTEDLQAPNEPSTIYKKSRKCKQPAPKPPKLSSSQTVSARIPSALPAKKLIKSDSRRKQRPNKLNLLEANKNLHEVTNSEDCARSSDNLQIAQFKSLLEEFESLIDKKLISNSKSNSQVTTNQSDQIWNFGGQTDDKQSEPEMTESNFETVEERENVILHKRLIPKRMLSHNLIDVPYSPMNEKISSTSSSKVKVDKVKVAPRKVASKPSEEVTNETWNRTETERDIASKSESNVEHLEKVGKVLPKQSKGLAHTNLEAETTEQTVKLPNATSLNANPDKLNSSKLAHSKTELGVLRLHHQTPSFTIVKNHQSEPAMVLPQEGKGASLDTTKKTLNNKVTLMSTLAPNDGKVELRGKRVVKEDEAGENISQLALQRMRSSCMPVSLSQYKRCEGDSNVRNTVLENYLNTPCVCTKHKANELDILKACTKVSSSAQKGASFPGAYTMKHKSNELKGNSCNTISSSRCLSCEVDSRAQKCSVESERNPPCTNTMPLKSNESMEQENVDSRLPVPQSLGKSCGGDSTLKKGTLKSLIKPPCIDSMTPKSNEPFNWKVMDSSLPVPLLRGKSSGWESSALKETLESGANKSYSQQFINSCLPVPLRRHKSCERDSSAQKGALEVGSNPLKFSTMSHTELRSMLPQLHSELHTNTPNLVQSHSTHFASYQNSMNLPDSGNPLKPPNFFQRVSAPHKKLSEGMMASSCSQNNWSCSSSSQNGPDSRGPSFPPQCKKCEESIESEQLNQPADECCKTLADKYYKSKTHSVLDVQTIPMPPIPIAINCVPKQKPVFPPKRPEHFKACQVQENRATKSSFHLHQPQGVVDNYSIRRVKDLLKFLDSKYCSFKLLVMTVLANIMAAIRSKAARAVRSTVTPAAPNQHSSAPLNESPTPTYKTKQTKLPLKHKSILKHKTQSAAKTRRIKSVKKPALDDESKQVISEEEEKRKAVGSITNPTLSYSEVLNIIFRNRR